MTDDEIITYCLELLKDIQGRGRNAHFHTVLCIVVVDEKGAISKPVMIDGTLEGRIIEAEDLDKRRIEGFPFESLFWVTEYSMLLGDLHHLSDEEKRKGLFNHRERAIEKAIPTIKEMM